jgi:hypothetical protein
MRSFLLLATGVCTLFVATSVARADEGDKDRAASLFAEGRRLMAAEDYAAACPKLAESQALDPAPDTAFDLGVCYQRASQSAFKAAHDLAHLPESSTAAASAPALATAPVPDEPRSGSTQRTVGLVIGGVGVAGLVVGVATAVAAKSQDDSAITTCSGVGACAPPAISKIESARGLADASTISFVAGAAALGTGAILFFTAPTSKPGVGASVGLGPAAEGTGLAVAGRF